MSFKCSFTVLFRKCNRITSFCGRSDSSGPRCEMHINSGLDENSTDFRCQVAGCAEVIFTFDSDMNAHLCSAHSNLSKREFMKLNKEFHAASKIQNKVHNVKASGSILAVNLPSDHDNNSDSSFIDLSNDDDSDLESSDGDSPMETPSTNITTWSRILDGNPSHGLSDNLGRKRKRRTSSTSEVSGKRKVSKVNTTDPKRVKVKTRLEEYPNEPFQDVLGRLWCSCCNTEVSLKRSSIKNLKPKNLKPTIMKNLKLTSNSLKIYPMRKLKIQMKKWICGRLDTS